MKTNEMTMSEFKAVVGEMDYSQKVFSGNAGGAPDDSFRGFGPTEQYWNVPTTNGWTVRYGDNGADIVSAMSPTGATWQSDTRSVDTWTFERIMRLV